MTALPLIVWISLCICLDFAIKCSSIYILVTHTLIVLHHV